MYPLPNIVIITPFLCYFCLRFKYACKSMREYLLLHIIFILIFLHIPLCDWREKRCRFISRAYSSQYVRLCYNNWVKYSYTPVVPSKRLQWSRICQFGVGLAVCPRCYIYICALMIWPLCLNLKPFHNLISYKKCLLNIYVKSSCSVHGNSRDVVWKQWKGKNIAKVSSY